MASTTLPDDTIFEILTHVPLQTLDMCKAVHENWKDIIKEPTFQSLYCKRTHTLSGYYIQDIIKNKHISEFVSINRSCIPAESVKDLSKHDTQILASSNQGILCCVRRGDKHVRYYICKPCTNQWRQLPNPKTRYTTVSVGLIVLGSNPLRFKIIRISKPNYWLQFYLRNEVFDSTKWEWKEANKIILPKGEFSVNSVAVTASKSIYWLTNDKVLRFDVDKETVSRFSLPEDVKTNEDKKLMEYEGRLGLSCMIEKRFFELWVVSNDGNHAWNKKITVDMTDFVEENRLCSPTGFYNSDITFIKDVFKVMFYKSQSRTFDVVKFRQLYYAGESFQFRSDFEKINIPGQPMIVEADDSKVMECEEISYDVSEI